MLYLRLLGQQLSAGAIECRLCIALFDFKLCGPFVDQVAGNAQLKCDLRAWLLTALEQRNCCKLELIAKALTLAMQRKFVNRFTHKTSPKVLSTFKNVRETRVTSI